MVCLNPFEDKHTFGLALTCGASVRVKTVAAARGADNVNALFSFLSELRAVVLRALWRTLGVRLSFVDGEPVTSF